MPPGRLMMSAAVDEQIEVQLPAHGLLASFVMPMSLAAPKPSHAARPRASYRMRLVANPDLGGRGILKAARMSPDKITIR